MAAKRIIKKQSPSQEQKASLFPKIYRFITESWKLILCSLASAVVLVAIVFQSIALYQNLQKEKLLRQEREKTVQELNQWKGKLGEYKNYRDVYFKIAALNYKLGDMEESKIYIKKALEIDPNFKDGRVLGAKVGL